MRGVGGRVTAGSLRVPDLQSARDPVKSGWIVDRKQDIETGFFRDRSVRILLRFEGQEQDIAFQRMLEVLQVETFLPKHAFEAIRRYLSGQAVDDGGYIVMQGGQTHQFPGRDCGHEVVVEALTGDMLQIGELFKGKHPGRVKGYLSGFETKRAECGTFGGLGGKLRQTVQ